jgi:hypothetical protein
MSETNLTKWIEQAEARAICGLAVAEPGAVQVSRPLLTKACLATGKTQNGGLFGRLRHRLVRTENVRLAE